MTQVLQIVPRVPPAMCGIGDYTWRLARELRAAHGIECSFLSAGTQWIQPCGETEFPVSRLPELSCRALVDYVRSHGTKFSAIVLHVSLYGYQKRGVPLWLGAALGRLAAFPVRPAIMSMFHELAADGPLTSSAFWLKGLQKIALRRLVRASDGMRTNHESYGRWLESVPHKSGSKVTVMPVFSNFGELATPPPLAERDRAMIMFTYGIHGGARAAETVKLAASLAQRFSLDTLHLVGGQPTTELDGLPVRVEQHPRLSAEDLSKLLTRCHAAYSAYNPFALGKSTLLASFAAHGLAVITTGENLPESLPDGLHIGKELLAAEKCIFEDAPADANLQLYASNLHGWYQTHSLARNAESYARDIRESVESRQAKS